MIEMHLAPPEIELKMLEQYPSFSQPDFVSLKLDTTFPFSTFTSSFHHIP